MLAYLFLIVAIAIRFVPHIWNFSPLGAALLFFGYARPKKEWAPALLFVMFGDLLLTTQVYHLPIEWQSFGSAAYYVLAVFIGSLLKEKADVLRVAAASISGSIAFFVISNFVAWLSLPMYTKDFHGLVQAYVLAIPFFRSTFAGDLVYSAVMFGTPLAIAAMQRRQTVAIKHS